MERSQVGIRNQTGPSRGGGSGLSAHKQVRPWGAGGLLLGSRANSMGYTASSGSEAVGLLRMGTLAGSSTLGVRHKALSAEAGTTTSQGQIGATLNHGGKAFGELLHCTSEHPLGHPGMNGTPLDGHGQCHHFFIPHLLIILSSLEILRRKVIPSPQHP